MKVLTVVLAICMLSVIGCSNDNDNDALYDAIPVPTLIPPTPTPTPIPLYKKAEMTEAEIVALNKAESARLLWDYKTVVELLTPLAENGHPEAQYWLGKMYADGNGVPQHDKTAVYWYTFSAEQGNAKAQFELGNMYAYGKGIGFIAGEPLLYAHMWFNIANSQGGSGQLRMEQVELEMTAAEIARAQDLAAECFAKEFKGC